MNRLGHAFALSFSCAAVLAGCLDAPRPADAPAVPAETETAPMVPESGLVRFHDGLKEVVTPYIISEGAVIVEGDIRLGPASILAPEGSGGASIPLGKKSSNIEATAKFGQPKHWVEGYIPYQFSGNVDATTKNTIANAIRQWNRISPIPFIPVNGEADNVLFIMTLDPFSSSEVGKKGGSQMLSVASGASVASLKHEMGHAAGLWHEQSRSDRATNVSLTTTDPNLVAESENWKPVGQNSGPYDPTSLMHYSPGTFYYKKNDKGQWILDPTNTSTSSVTLGNLAGRPAINPSLDLTDGDIKGLITLYGPDLAWLKSTASKSVITKATTHLRTFRTASKYFALEYDKVSGEYRIYESLPSTGDIILRHSGSLGKNQDVVETYRVGSATFLVHYNSTGGAAKILRFNETGSLGPVVQTAAWGTGRTVIRVVTAETRTYMIRFIPRSGGAIYPVNADGSVSGLPTQDFEELYMDEIVTFSDLECPWAIAPGTVGTLPTSFLVYYQKVGGAANAQIIDKNGILQAVKPLGLMTNADEVHPYVANKRGFILCRSSSTGEYRLYDFRPQFAGNQAVPPFTEVRSYMVRNQLGTSGYSMRPLGYSPLGPSDATKMWVYKASTHNLHNWDIFPFKTPL